ncbi:MAG: NMD3-related protein [Candidatus Methanosuratincola petrocarbonis]
MGRFCAKCGSESGAYIRGLCGDCYWKGVDMEMPSDISVTMCPECRSYLQGKRWVERDEIADNDFKAVTAAEIELLRQKKLPEGVTLEGTDGEILDRDGNGLPKTMVLSLKLKEKSTGSEHKTSVLVSIEYATCGTCIRFARKEHEAVVQIRADGRDLDAEDQDHVERAIDEISKRGSEKKRACIVEVKEKEGGYDMKFATLATARVFAKRLHEDYGATVQESPKLVGVDRRTGGRVYKNTISIKMPRLRAGDLVSLRNNVYLLTGFDRGRAVVKDMRSREHRTLGLDEFAALEKLAEDEVKRVRLDGRTSTHVDFYDLKESSFIEVPPETVPPEMRIGEEGLLIRHSGKEAVYRIPKGEVQRG